MINRQISEIMGVPVNQFTAFAVDPHGRFVAMYLRLSNSVHVIRTLDFSSFAMDYIFPFIEQKRYEQSFSLQSNEIPSKLLNQSWPIEKIVISTISNSKQYILVSNCFSIETFSITLSCDNSNKLIAKREGVINGNAQRLIKTFSCHDGEIWVTYMSGDFDVYHKKDSRSYWSLEQYPLKVKKEVTRLIVIKKQKNQLLYQIQSRNRQFRKIYPVGKSRRCKLPRIYKLSHYFENLNQIQLKRSNYKCPAAQISQIIYIRSDNVLCSAKLLNDLKFSIRILCSNNKQPQKFHSKQEFYLFEKKKSQIPVPYLVCSNQNYIVCIEDDGYSILSKQFDWKKILYSSMLPTINPFFEEFLISALTNLVINQYDEHKNNIKWASEILLQKYQLALIIFSMQKDNLHQLQQFHQNSFLRLQLIAFKKTMSSQVQIQAQRYKILDLRMSNNDPKGIHWISPTEIIYFAQKNDQLDKFYYAKFNEETLLQQIDNVILHILVSNVKQQTDK